MVAPTLSLSPLSRPPSRRAEGHTPKIRPADRREKRFAQLVANGWTLAKAYESVSGAKKKETCERQGVRWAQRAAVAAEITRARNALTNETAASRSEKRNILARVMRDEFTPPSVIVSAVAVDNRMTGDDEPFRKAAGEDLRVSVFVIRLGEDASASVSAAPGFPADPADAARNVTPIDVTTTTTSAATQAGS